MSHDHHHFNEEESLVDQVLFKNDEYMNGGARYFDGSDQKSKIGIEIKLERNEEKKEEVELNLEKSSSKERKYQKWEVPEKKKYWFGMIGMVNNNPLVKHSWENWKIDKCFKKMEPLFGGTKVHSQIKSFDQRMKEQFLIQKGIDLEKAICIALRELNLTEEEAIALDEFEKLRASQTFNLGDEEKKTIELLEQDIIKLEEENKQLEELLKFFPELEQ